MEQTPTQEAELDRMGEAESEKSEDDLVREWRFTRLSRVRKDAGARKNDRWCGEAAASDVDVHDLERLLRANCPLELAWEILR